MQLTSPLSRRKVLEALALSPAGRAISTPFLFSRAEAEVSPDVVRFRAELEPLVSLIERTPRERCAEMTVEQLRRGVSYRQVLAAVFLAGIRNINPRPPGFALHCVFVIHSAHIIGMEAPADARLLPLLYALDQFKTSQERDARQPAGDYTMRAITGALPPPERAAAEFHAAMESWDSERAERAVAACARYRSAAEVFAELWRYGARDYRNIGHKAIFAANACRTLQAIGWQHAEPVLRSLTLALLDFGRQQKVNGYSLDDQCYSANEKRLKDAFPRTALTWSAQDSDPGAVRSIVGVIRGSTPEEACSDVAARLVKRQASSGSVWDAVHLAAAELRMRARNGAGLAAIHAVTSANALHYAYLDAAGPELRYLLLLQAVGWMTQFRTWAGSTPENLRTFHIADLEPSSDGSDVERSISEIFAAIPADADRSLSRAFRLARDEGSRRIFLSAALRQIAAKADEVHYYKYLAALIEDSALVSPEWQPHLVAATVYYLKGANDAETVPMKRAREALRSLAV